MFADCLQASPHTMYIEANPKNNLVVYTPGAPKEALDCSYGSLYDHWPQIMQLKRTQVIRNNLVAIFRANSPFRAVAFACLKEEPAK